MKEPKLFVYIRKNDDTELPFMVGEFHFACQIMSFIVPLSANDTRKFIDETEYQFFWDCFVHYNKSKGWIFNDYSNDTERSLNFIFNIQLPPKKD